MIPDYPSVKPRQAHQKTLENLDTIVSLYRSGKTMREIGEAFNLTRDQVATRLRLGGIRKRPFKTIDREMVVKLYHKGYNASRIASVLGSRAQTISRLLYELVPDYRTPLFYQRRDLSFVDWDEVIRWYHSGALRKDIAKHLCISKNRLEEEFRKRRVDPSPHLRVRKRQKPQKTKIPLNEVPRLREKGLSYDRIGQLIGGFSGSGVRLAYLRSLRKEI